MSLSATLHKRYATKAFDSTKKIDDALFEQLLDALRFSPSSTNSQPWHFIVASSDEGKERIAATCQDNLAYNAAKIRNASHTVVLCARTDIDADYLEHLLDVEETDGRYPNPEGRAAYSQLRGGYIEKFKAQRGDISGWIDRQVYIALGNLLLAAGVLGVDAVAMEGINGAALEHEFSLNEQGFRPLVAVALGYAAAEDPNASLPKSRLPRAEIFTMI